MRFCIKIIFIIAIQLSFNLPLYAQNEFLLNDAFQYYYIKWTKNIVLTASDFRIKETTGRKDIIKLNEYSYINDGQFDKYLDSSGNNISSAIDEKKKNTLDSLFRHTIKYNDSILIKESINKSNFKKGYDSFKYEGTNIYIDFRLLTEIHKLLSSYYNPINTSLQKESFDTLEINSDTTFIDFNVPNCDIQRNIIRLNDTTYYYNIFAFFLPYQSILTSYTILNLIHQQNKFDECEVYARKFRKSVSQCLKILNYERIIDSLNNNYKIVNSYYTECMKHNNNKYNCNIKMSYSLKLKNELMWSEKIKKELESLKEYEKPEGTIIVKKRK